MPSRRLRPRVNNKRGLDDLAPHLDLRRGARHQYHAVVAAIRRFGFMPLVGGAPGLRQPVHAEDLAIGAIAAAASPAAINKFYSLPGAETLSYREMIGRIFDGLEMPRRTISVPPLLWRAGFAPGETAVSRRQCRDGYPHDEGHDFRFHAGQSATSAGIRRAFNPKFK